MTVAFVMSHMSMSRLLKEAHAAKISGWKVYLIGYKISTCRTAPDNFDPWFDEVIHVDKIKDALHVLFRINPDIIHSLCWVGNEISAVLIDTFPERTIFDPYDTGVLRNFQGIKGTIVRNETAYQHFCYSKAVAICARDLRTSWLRKKGYINNKNHILLYQDYLWNQKVTTPKIGKNGELHFVLIGSFGGSEDNSYTRIVQALCSQGIHLHIYPTAHIEINVEKYDLLEKKYKELHIYKPLPYDKIRTELEKYDLGLNTISALLDGKELENYYQEEFRFCSITMRECDYIDAGLPIMINSERNYALRQIKNYGLGIEANWDLLKKGRRELAEFVNNPDLRDRIQKFKQNYSIESQAPRLDAFYKQIKGFKSKYFGLGTKWKRPASNENQNSINLFTLSNLARKRILLISSNESNIGHYQSCIKKWDKLHAWMRQEGAIIQLLSNTDEEYRYRKQLFHHHNGWVYQDLNVEDIAQKIVSGSYHHLQEGDVKLLLEADRIELKETPYFNKSNIKLYDLVLVDNASVALALKQEDIFSESCVWGMMLNDSPEYQNYCQTEITLFQSANIIISHHKETVEELERLGLENVTTLNNHNQLTSKLMKVLNANRNQSTDNLSRTIVVDTVFNPGLNRLDELLTNFIDRKGIPESRIIVIGNQPQKNRRYKSTPLPIFTDKPRITYKEGHAKEAIEEWLALLKTPIRRHLRPGDQIIGFQVQPIELWAWADFLGSFQEWETIELKLYMEMKDYTTPDAGHITVPSLQILQNNLQNHSITLCVDSPDLKCLIEDVCNLKVQVSHLCNLEYVC